MKKRFLLSLIIVYAFFSISGYLVHDILLHKQYMALMPTLHSENIKSKIWAFIVESTVGCIFFTLIYSSWKKSGTIKEGLTYGIFIGLWIGLDMSLRTYASTDLIPFSLIMQWLIYGLLQYAIGGCLLAFVYNYRTKNKE